MTVSSTPRKAGPFTGNSSATAFPFAFKVLDSAHLRVVKRSSAGVETDLVEDTHYSVSLNVDQDATPGGTVTYPISGAKLSSSERLVIVSDVPYDQPLDLLSGGAFSALVIENQYDYIEMQIQQMLEWIGRAVVTAITSGTSGGGGYGLTFPPPVAYYLIGWNASGTGLTNYAPGLFGGGGGGAIDGEPLDGTDFLELINTGVEGDLLMRGALAWQMLPKGLEGQVLSIVPAGSDGTGNPQWFSLNGLIDAAYDAADGDLLMFSDGEWAKLPQGTDGQSLTIVPVSFGGTGLPQWATLASVPETWGYACSDETTAITTGTKVKFLAPYPFRLEPISGGFAGVKAYLTTAQTGGALFTIDVKVAGVSIFATQLTFDNGERSTHSATAAYVLAEDPYTIPGNSEVEILVTQIGDGTAKGLKVYLIGKFVLG